MSHTVGETASDPSTHHDAATPKRTDGERPFHPPRHRNQPQTTPPSATSRVAPRAPRAFVRFRFVWDTASDHIPPATDTATNPKRRPPCATSRVAPRAPRAFDRFRFVWDTAIDFLFLLDCALNFRSAYSDRNDRTVVQPRKIVVHYLSTWFVIDLFSSIPFDLFGGNGDDDDEGGGFAGLTRATKILKVGRVLKVFKLLRVSNVLGRHADAIEQARGHVEKTNDAHRRHAPGDRVSRLSAPPRKRTKRRPHALGDRFLPSFEPPRKRSTRRRHAL